MNATKAVARERVKLAEQYLRGAIQALTEAHHILVDLEPRPLSDAAYFLTKRLATLTESDTGDDGYSVVLLLEELSR